MFWSLDEVVGKKRGKKEKRGIKKRKKRRNCKDEKINK